MHHRSRAIIIAARAHGEHGMIVRTLTEGAGMLSGYVRGGRSRRIRPNLSVGNIVLAEFRARSETQLASLAAELITSRASLLSEALPLAAVEWVTALAAVSLPEGHPYPRIYAALDGVLSAIEAASAARGWVPAVERYEHIILAELGYGDQGPCGLVNNGNRLRENVLTGRRAAILPARDRLIQRIDRAMGR